MWLRPDEILYVDTDFNFTEFPQPTGFSSCCCWVLTQWSPTFLVPGTGFVEFFHAPGWGWWDMVSGWFQCITFIVYSISIIFITSAPAQNIRHKKKSGIRFWRLGIPVLKHLEMWKLFLLHGLFTNGQLGTVCWPLQSKKRKRALLTFFTIESGCLFSPASNEKSGNLK